VYIERVRTLALLSFLLSVACTEKAVENATDTGIAAVPRKRIDPATTSSISGTVRFGGALPEPTMINASGDGACLKMRPGTFDAGDVKVKDGKVENAFVWISAGAEGYEFDQPKDEITIDQKGCMYTPRIVGARAGQNLVFTNSDETIHNIKSTPKTQKGWNFVTPAAGRGTRTLGKQEVMVKLGCDVHPWMSAWVGILEHPFFAVTDGEGRFQIAGVPAGAYTLSAWHERLGTVEKKITVDKSGAPIELDLPGAK
jgi:hypothetical protein